MTLTDFLLKRIAEDETHAPSQHWQVEDSLYHCCPALRTEADAGDLEWGEDNCDCGLTQRRTRVLAECETKRRIIGLALLHMATIDGEWGCCHSADAIRDGHCEATNPDEDEVLLALAVPYADHPEYREEAR